MFAESVEKILKLFSATTSSKRTEISLKKFTCLSQCPLDHLISEGVVKSYNVRIPRKELHLQRANCKGLVYFELEPTEKMSRGFGRLLIAIAVKLNACTVKILPDGCEQLTWRVSPEQRLQVFTDQ